MRPASRQIIELIGPGRGGRWIALIALAIVASVFEAVGALLVFVLLRLVTDPAGGVDLPVVGDLAARFPSLDQQELVMAVAGFIAVFFLLRATLYLSQSYLQNRISYNTGVYISTRLLRGYLAVPYSEHLRRSSAESIRNAHESAHALAQQVLVPAVGLISELLLVVVVFVVLFVVAPAVTALTLLVLVPLVVVLVRGLQPWIVRLGEASQVSSAHSLQWLTQTLVGYRDIKLLGREAFFEQRFAESRARLSTAFYVRSVLVDIPRVGVETGLILFILAFLALSVEGDGAAGSGTVTVLGFFAYAGLRLLPSLNRIMVNVQMIRFGTRLIGNLYDDLESADAAVRESKVEGPTVPLTFDDSLVLEGVSLRYEGADRDAITEIDLRIRRGEWIGIVGPTGGGKTTLVDTIVGFLDPTAGRVLVDGVDIAGARRSWQRRLGIVPQTLFLLDDTIRRNVALGRDDEEVDEEAVRRAVQLARLESFVATLPDGLDTMVGERGVKLSGGQRQRVAIARALYADPDVIVFDEGTSALDTATETDVIAALQGLRGERTLLTVAHRMTTVRPCDRIVVVRDGRVAAVGSFDELQQTSEDFQSLTR